VGTTNPTLSANPAGTQQLQQAYGQLPIRFEANQGQTDAQVKFLARGSGYTVFLTPTGAVLSLQQESGGGDVIRMQLAGANPAPAVLGRDELPGKSNYLIGNDPAQWHPGVANYGKVEYENVYPGVNLVYYGNQQQLEYDFQVAPGANPQAIALSFQGARDVTLDGQGDLVLHTSGSDVVEHAPVLYQENGGVRQSVSGQYVLEGNGQVGFRVGAYDHSKPLVIDPVLSYSTYLGGSSNDEGFAIAVDTAGNAYVAGRTNSTNFPTTPGAFQGSDSASYDAFVTKLNAAGNALAYSTYLGGNDLDTGDGIAVDAAGNAYVTGWTRSSNFPTTPGAFQTTDPAKYDGAFVTKLNPTGSALVYSTYLGAYSGNTRAYGIAINAVGDAWVTGWTGVNPFPTTAGAYQNKFGGGGQDAFVTELNAMGSALLYSTYLGGSGGEAGQGIAVDAAGDAYVSGNTSSSNFPTTAGCFEPTQAYSGTVGFIAKLDPSQSGGASLIYSTYFNDVGGLGSIAVDSAGNAYVTGGTGGTHATSYPTVNALQPVYGGNGDTTVAKLNAAGSALIYSTYLGGSGSDGSGSIAVDAAGNAYVTGNTFSTDFPMINPVQAANGGAHDAFVTKINAAGSALVYSTYLGGSADEYALGIAVDAAGSAYVTGETFSTNFPTVNAFQPAYPGGSYSAFVAKIAAPASPSFVVTGFPSPTIVGAAGSFTVTAENADESTNTGYTGTVHFTSTDPQAALPADYTFSAADQGVHTFNATLATAGLRSLSVADIAAPSVDGVQVSILVNPAAATQFALSGPSGVTAGTAFSLTVTALDAYGNTATGYTGTVHFSSSDSKATLPGNYTFTAADNGVHTFSGLKLKTTGTQTVTVKDTASGSITGSWTIKVS
jgi:hypothetical protein